MSDAVKIALIGLICPIATLLFNRLFSLRDRKTSKTDEREKRIEALENLVGLQKSALERAEKDNCRIQMLIMMMHYPEEKTEIMKLAEHYASIGGNWYMSTLFDKWLDSQGLERPSWWETNVRE